MLAVGLGWATASPLKDIGDAGAQDASYVHKNMDPDRTDRRIVFTWMCSLEKGGGGAPTRPMQLRGTGRLSARGLGFSLSGKDHEYYIFCLHL